MSNLLLLNDAEQDLNNLRAQLSLGETVTLANAEGRPLALLVSLQEKTVARKLSIQDPFSAKSHANTEMKTASQAQQDANEKRCGLFRLKGLVAGLSLGETVTLSDDEGHPLALLVSLQEVAAKQQAVAGWREQMEELAKKVSAAWNSDQTAVETIAEMRR